MTDNEIKFIPHPLIQNPHIQTLLSVSGKGLNPSITDVEQEIILHIPIEGGVKLQGFYYAQPKRKCKGLVLLLHGWLGSAKSGYMIAVSDFLYQQGYAIFCLNMRDHGDSVHLNEEMFHGCRLEEVFLATQQIASIEANLPFFIAGFSMGGNFALRLAWQHSQEAISNLRHVIAISPSLKPEETLIAMDNTLYRMHFLLRWQNKMRQKQAAYPDLYDFSELLKCKTSYEMSEIAIPRYTGFATCEAFYQSYNVKQNQIDKINVPTTIITAKDDPFIPISHFQMFKGLNPHLSLFIQSYGGHVGFVDIFPWRYWLAEAILKVIK